MATIVHPQLLHPDIPGCVLTITGETLNHRRFVFFDSQPVGLTADPFDTLSILLWKRFTSDTGQTTHRDFPSLGCESHFRQRIRRLRTPIAAVTGKAFSEQAISRGDVGGYVLAVPRAHIRFAPSCWEIARSDVSVDWCRLLALATENERLTVAPG